MSDRHAALYAEITDQLVASIEAGTPAWRKGWASSGLALRHNGEPYRGFNQLILSLIAGARGYASPYWMTFKQALELGGSVRKGERSSIVIFYTMIGGTPGTKDKGRPMMKTYRAFNASQCDGLPMAYDGSIHENQDARDEDKEAVLRACGATIVEAGNQPCYVPARDVVMMPAYDQFKTLGCYLATLAHELIHWTGGPKRIARIKASWTPEEYAFEELVAEIGAAFACARLGVTGEHLDNHAAYLASWLKLLKAEPRALFRAAGQAQAAADYLFNPEGE